ncbi:MAG: hypothetical protein ABIW94_08765, partial [Gemmatimonadaceae bacterium]
ADGTYTQRNPGGDREIATHDLLLGDPWGVSAFNTPEAPAEGAEPPADAVLQSAFPSSSS